MVTEGINKQYPPIQTWPYQQVIDMSEVLKKLDLLDKKLGAKNCYEPVKEDVLKQLENRIEVLEKLHQIT
jgi:hypothetical protein